MKFLFLIHNRTVFRVAIGSYVTGAVQWENAVKIFHMFIGAENAASFTIMTTLALAIIYGCKSTNLVISVTLSACQCDVIFLHVHHQSGMAAPNAIIMVLHVTEPLLRRKTPIASAWNRPSPPHWSIIFSNCSFALVISNALSISVIVDNYKWWATNIKFLILWQMFCNCSIYDAGHW